MIVPIAVRLFEFLSGICAAGAAIGCLYLLVAAVAVLRFRKTGEPAAAPPEPVTVLKPLHGAEPGLPQRLAAVCGQDYGAEVQIVCGVQDRADPAIGTVEALAEQRPVDLVVDARRHSRNPKICNLTNMLPLARHDLLVIADSDIDVDPDYLRQVAAELQKPGVGAVSCLYTGVADGGIWAELSALAINAHFLPSVLLALDLRLATPCFGTTIALRRSMLSRIGGFEAFGDVLAEDYEIGRAVREAGSDVSIPAFSIRHVCFEDSLGKLAAHDLRVARTVKSIDWIGYCGSVITHPFALAVLSVLFGGGGNALILAAIALACRAALCLCVEHTFGLARQPYWLLPIRDVLSFAAYFRGLFGNAVSWRGATYQVGWDGELAPDREGA